MTETEVGRVKPPLGVAVALALGVALVAVLGAVRTPARPDGQVVAVPAPSVQPSTTGPTVEILECTASAEGLRVRGEVGPSAARQEPEGQIVLAVTGSADSTAGRAVGAGFARAAGFGDTVGSFLLDLPWAQVTSTFAVVLPDSAATPERRTGPAARCPG